MSLCPACSNISVPNLTSELNDVPPGLSGLRSKPNKPRGMLHLDDAQQLIASASAGCPFCGLIVHAVLQEINTVGLFAPTNASPSPFSKNEQDLQLLQRNLLQHPIYLQTNYDPVKPSFPDNDSPGSWHIRGLKVLVPVDHYGVVVGRIRLFAPRDSPVGARCDIIGRPALSSSDSPEAFELIERWMDTCLTKHHACRESLSGTVIDENETPVLPSRVIYVGKSVQGSSPRLLETAGRKGHYIALSHCWGPPTHRPLMTTQSSLVRHLTSISWDELPKLYQDAITATRRLGFEYIWIDSLCIIQDSHLDWLSESRRMGNVYQHARLTIAASHAADSTQPCFFIRPAATPVVELPCVDASGQADGSLYASALTSDFASISPESGALAFRAWATQEWLLSRRMIFYTAGSLVWSCRTVSQRETGALFHSTARNPRWKNLIEKYSARKITKQTDRLIALEGIRNELAKKRTDDAYYLGLWKNSMPDQLLWYCLQPGERHICELDLPTWTWASTLHGVRFLDLAGAKSMCDAFRFDDATKRLTLRGAVKAIPSIIPLALADKESGYEAQFADVPHKIVPANMHFAVLDSSTLPIGWCVLDEGVVPESELYGLQLMGKVLKVQADIGKRRLHVDSILLLRTDDRQTFRRVGVGRIVTSKPWFGDCGATTVRLG